MSPPQNGPAGDQLIHHPAQVGIGQGQWLTASMPGPPHGLGGAHLRHQRVDAEIAAQWCAPLVPPQRGEKATFGEAPLGGVDRSLAHSGSADVGGGPCPVDRDPDRVRLLV